MTAFLRVTPPLVRNIQGLFRRYAVRKGLVRMQYAEILLYRTQTSIFTLKRSNIYQETQHT